MYKNVLIYCYVILICVVFCTTAGQDAANMGAHSLQNDQGRLLQFTDLVWKHSQAAKHTQDRHALHSSIESKNDTSTTYRHRHRVFEASAGSAAHGRSLHEDAGSQAGSRSLKIYIYPEDKRFTELVRPIENLQVCAGAC